jgi:hypothetical protein
MSERFPGGIISKTAPVPTGPYESGTAPGIWTLDQQLQYKQQGVWPTAGLQPNYIEDVFSTWLYTGNGFYPSGGGQTIVNNIDLAGKGGLIWIKARSTDTSHGLYDTARGINQMLGSNNTFQQYTDNAMVSANSNGFTLGSESSGWTRINSNGQTYASWTFRKQPKFFDVVTWTGDSNSYQIIPHNLGSTPGCVIVKNVTTTGDWGVWHRSTGTQNLVLNSTSAAGATYVDKISADATDITVVSPFKTSGQTYVAYLFAHDAGGFGLTGTDNVISCGSYAGTGSPLSVTLGYEPQWILVKRTSTAGNNWVLMDTMRGMSLTQASWLYPNTSSAEVDAGVQCNPTATGFDITSTGSNLNDGSSTYIYIAIRRGPMKVPTDGTKVFTPILIAGNGSTRFMSTGFPVDLKLHSALSAATHVFSDRLRGGGVDTTPKLYSQFTNAENLTTGGRGVLFDSNTGYTLTFNEGNATGDNYIHYAMRRAPSFFDEVCYTGTYTNRTIAHNLAAAPELMILKSRSVVTQRSVYSSTIGPTGLLRLNTTGAADTAPGRGAYWNSTAPTASVFSLGLDGDVNDAGTTYVNYLFASCPGVSKVGSYTGNATTQVINCGFTAGARFVMIKRIDSTGDWYVWDSARGIVAGNDPYLLLNSTAAEVTGTDYVDTAASGFELSSTAPAAINASGGTFIFLAIA